MATNQGNSSRKGAIRSRSQFFNPSTGHYIKRDSSNGHFLDVKADGEKFKGVRIEKAQAKANPNISKDQAIKAEMAVVSVLNKTKQA